MCKEYVRRRVCNECVIVAVEVVIVVIAAVVVIVDTCR